MKPNIAEIRARAEASTSGPWTVCKDHENSVLATIRDPRDALIAAPNYGRDDAFIAAARTDVPALCAEVERLERLLEEACDLAGSVEGLPFGGNSRSNDEYWDRIDAIRKELAGE